MYEAVTRGIRVRVTPQYLEEQSSRRDGRYAWACKVGIGNGSYQVTTGSGASIDVMVPAFSLDSLHSKPRFN